MFQFHRIKTTIAKTHGMIIATYQLSAFNKMLHRPVALPSKTTTNNIQKIIASFVSEQDHSSSDEPRVGENFFGQSNNCSIDTYNKNPKLRYMKKCRRKWLTAERLIHFLVIITVMMISQLARAQGAVTGHVKDKSGNPIPGATITVKNSKVTTAADVDGNFSIIASANDVLEVTSIGYDIIEVRVGSERNILIELVTRVTSLEDLVVVGYGTQKRKDLTGSIVNINTNETKKYSTSDISQLLQGRATGVQVNSDGHPGAVPSVRIRGYSTFGNAQPFYVVDGVPGSIDQGF